LILDEPFSGLDPLLRDEFMEQLLKQAGEMTTLISSHELNEIEGVTSHVAFLDEGRLLFHESMMELTARFREIRVTTEHPVHKPKNIPSDWVDMRVTGNVISFVDTRFCDEGLSERMELSIGNIRHVDAQPMSLRSIFTMLARTVRDGGEA